MLQDTLQYEMQRPYSARAIKKNSGNIKKSNFDNPNQITTENFTNLND